MSSCYFAVHKLMPFGYSGTEYNASLNWTEKNSTADVGFLTRIAYGYISPVIISFGIFGDIMTIFILSHPLLRRSSVIYLYLTALAITDLFTLLSVIPMVLWLLDVKLCSLSAAVFYAHMGFPLANAFMSASVWIVVFLTLGQYLAVCHPFYDRLRSKRVCCYLTLIAYALSFAIYIPWGWKKSVYHIPWNHDCPFVACDNSDVATAVWFQGYQWVREAISRFMPFVLVAYFNIRILTVYRATKIDRLNRISRVQQRTVAEKSALEEKRLWMLLFGIITVFFVCTIPAAPLTILVSDKWAKDFNFQIVRAIINILEFTKFALNFYFYCMINPDIRRLALKRLTCQGFTKPALVASRHTHQLSAYLNHTSANLSAERQKSLKHKEFRHRKSAETELLCQARSKSITYCKFNNNNNRPRSFSESAPANGNCLSVQAPLARAEIYSNTSNENVELLRTNDEIQL